MWRGCRLVQTDAVDRAGILKTSFTYLRRLNALF
jgi:hypothetical protein